MSQILGLDFKAHMNTQGWGEPLNFISHFLFCESCGGSYRCFIRLDKH